MYKSYFSVPSGITMESLRQDLRFATRALAKNPGNSRERQSPDWRTLMLGLRFPVCNAGNSFAGEMSVRGDVFHHKFRRRVIAQYRPLPIRHFYKRRGKRWISLSRQYGVENLSLLRP